MAEFAWTKQREEAAQLVALGELSDTDVARKLEIGRTTLWEWRQEPAFMGRVDAIIEEIRVTFRRRAIGMMERRVARLNSTWLKLQQVIEERSIAPELQNVAGGKTGTVAHKVKGVGSGDAFQLIDEYEVDIGLLKEIREIEKQAAIELGQWSVKVEHSEGKPAPHRIADDDTRFLEGDEHPPVEGDPGPGAAA